LVNSFGVLRNLFIWSQEGWIIINCDGAYKKSMDLAGCGGLLRD
jgi:hypothetical protein